MTGASVHCCCFHVPNTLRPKELIIIAAASLYYRETYLIYREASLCLAHPVTFTSPARKELTTWPGAMASWEWNVECCVCRASFPASLTAQAHANDQYYWSTIDGLATKQEKLITTKALLSFNYKSSMAISVAQRPSPTLIS